MGKYRNNKPSGYWTKAQCKIEALKYNHRREFQISCGSGYMKAATNKWIDDICSHMKPIGDKYKRCVYVFEFKESKTCYVGLTCNLSKRKSNHMVNGPVHNFINNTNEKFELIQLTDYIEAENAQLLEGEYVEKYKNNNWNILNTLKTGGLGCLTIVKYTIDECRVLASKCKNRWEFNQTYNKEYQVCLKNNWLDTICIHMVNKKENGFWNGFWNDFEKCYEASKKCKNKTEFIKKYDSAYRYCVKNQWIDKIKFK